jgi:phosphopantothenoylcysteine decarboxylase/phosphopantothenate--cysteine ligase
VFITAGPTWVPIDNVRVISNIATGETGILLAEELNNLGAKITLLLGPVGICCLNRKIKIIRYKFFDDLRNRIEDELRSKKYDIVIHSAAVSDYKTKRIYPFKVKSGIKNWKINLVPAQKVINLIKEIDSSLFLVGFKFEPKANCSSLIEKTKDLIRRARLDLAIANTINNNSYRAYIMDKIQVTGPFLRKADLVRALIKEIEAAL